MTTAPRCLLFCRNSGYDDDLDVYDGRIGLCRTHAAETTARGQRWCKVCQRRYAGACCPHILIAKREREAARRQDPAHRAACVVATRAWRAANPAYRETAVVATRAWRAANPAKYRAAAQVAYRRMMDDPIRAERRRTKMRAVNALYGQRRDRRAAYQRAKLRQWQRLMGTR